MNLPYELEVGLRYTRAGRSSQSNRFISFISGVSMLGIALGVASLRSKRIRKSWALRPLLRRRPWSRAGRT